MSDSSRYFANDSSSLRRADARKELQAYLQAIVTNCPLDEPPPNGWNFMGLYTGPTSIAYLFFKLSQTHPTFEINGRSMHDWCLAYLEPGRRLHRHEAGKLDPKHCGIGQEYLANLAVTAAVTEDASLAENFCDLADEIITRNEEGSDEWLYGLAGYLYLLRLIEYAFPDHDSVQEKCEDATQKVVQRMLQSTIPWKWHGKTYLGAAHGTLGIMAQIVLSSPSHAPKLQDLLSSMLDLQFPSGNFPSLLPVGSDKLVQFCHGAPGFVLSLMSLRSYFPTLQARIDAAAEKARNCVWERGLLTKGPSLCHGITGNALVFEDIPRFEHFLSFTTRQELETRWRPAESNEADVVYGLYTGEAGRAWVWAVADVHLQKSCLGFNDL